MSKSEKSLKTLKGQLKITNQRRIDTVNSEINVMFLLLRKMRLVGDRNN